MDILCTNAERDFMALMSLIVANPKSWDGWKSLHVTLDNLDEDQEQDCVIWMRSIIGSYLNNVQGRAYFCFGRDIHVICKGVHDEILKQTGMHLCELISAEQKITSYYEIFDLREEGFIYQQTSFHGRENFMSFLLPFEARQARALENIQKIHSKIDLGAKNKGENTLSLPKVLLVEDDPVARWMVRNALKNDCDFATAPCANKAFSMYSSYQPDLVFLDIDLPDQSGKNVLEWIMRNDPGGRVIMFSSNDTMDNITDALRMGASGFISKPFLRDNFLHYIQEKRA